MSILNIFSTTIAKANNWFYQTPERALDLAYQAALNIKAIEDQHFQGKTISADYGDYGDSSLSYFEFELNRYLNEIKIRLTEFNTSRNILKLANPKYARIADEHTLRNLEKLNFIDQIKNKYEDYSIFAIIPNQVKAIVPVEDSQLSVSQSSNKNSNKNDTEDILEHQNNNSNRQASITDKTGFMPRSILGTFSKIQKDLEPKSEDEALNKFRRAKKRTFVSIKFILSLILIPLLMQQIVKLTVADYVVNNWIYKGNYQIFINDDLQEEAFKELEIYERDLQFKSLIGIAPKLNGEQLEEKLKEKAEELKIDYHEKSVNALKNIIADAAAIVTLTIFFITSKREFLVLRSFLDETVYGLSDSAKAFIIILFTDIFVGFHSPHGWEVILDSLFKHLGLAENHAFMFIFIAIFPVILDVMIKYWIFRYLNRLSPSAVATYKNMNE